MGIHLPDDAHDINLKTTGKNITNWFLAFTCLILAGTAYVAFYNLVIKCHVNTPKPGAFELNFHPLLVARRRTIGWHCP